MMKLLFLSLLAFVSCSANLYADDTLSPPATEVMVRAHDGIELSLYQYPATGDSLVLWIGGNGWHDRSIQLARDFSRTGIEVWQIDFAEALMQTANSNFMRNLDAQYIADIIDAAHQRGKRVILFAQAYGAIPVLRGATLWQQRKNHAGKLLGAILFSPDLVTGLPALGQDPEYLPITRATNIPMMIYQGGLHGSAKHFSRLIGELGSHNPHVFFNVLPGVTSVFYHDEDSPAALALLKDLPEKVNGLFKLFESLPVPLARTHYVQSNQLSIALPDIKLKSFAGGNPLPHAIDLQDANGRRFILADYRGKITVVNFWASWCPPCVEEIPSLNRLREHMQDQPFEMISINYAEGPEKIRAFLQRVSVEFPVLIDPNGKVSQQWNVIGFPSTFVIGKDGKIVYGVNAAIHWDSAEVVTTLKNLAR